MSITSEKLRKMAGQMMRTRRGSIRDETRRALIEAADEIDRLQSEVKDIEDTAIAIIAAEGRRLLRASA